MDIRGSRSSAGRNIRRDGAVRRFGVVTLVGVLLALTGSVVMSGGPALAAPGLGLDPDTNPPSATTESTIVALENSSGLYGGQVPGVQATTPYPTSGLQDQRSVTTAQLILSTGTGANDRVATYCIDLDTDTTVGVHYELDSWTEANVPNLPYVQWILQNYYPQEPAQPVAGSASQKVRAVQGAIWYFTDGFVVNRFYPTERQAVKSIVEAAQAAVDPTPAPPVQPTLTVTPPTSGTPTPGTPFGPYTVGGSVAQSTIAINADTEVFTDAAGRRPLTPGASVSNGQQLYIGYDPAVANQGFVLSATATVPAGNVFLYDGANPPRTEAQKLIAATDSTVTLRAAGTLVPPAAGAYELSVSIAGEAGGDQGAIAVTVTCTLGGWELSRNLTVPARTESGTRLLVRLDGIVDGASCETVQTADGSNASATLSSSVLTPAAPVVIASGATSEVLLADEYSVPVAPTGTLAIDVRVDGAAAGLQSGIDARATCVVGSATVVRDVALAAGSTGTTRVGTFRGLPVGAVCGVVSTVDGRNDRAAFIGSSVSPESITVQADTTSVLTLTETYGLQVSEFRVDVVPTGAGAGLQGEGSVRLVCTSGDAGIDPVSVTIPAGLTERTSVGYVSGIPVGYSCGSTLESDGANALATLVSSSVTPEPIVSVYGETGVLTVSLDYSKTAPGPGPGPEPGPQPNPSLPSTGFDGSPYLIVAAAALIAGLIVLILQIRRRRGE